MAIRGVLFDVFSTLLDLHSVSVRAEQLFPGQGTRLSQLWREKQIEYTRLRTMSSRYVPFTQVTEDALQFAGEVLALPLDAAARGLLMHEYTQLAPYTDAVPALKRLQATGATIGELTNGDPGLIEDVLHGAQIAEYFDVLLSADQVHAYKTAPAVYELVPLTLRPCSSPLLFIRSQQVKLSGTVSYFQGLWREEHNTIRKTANHQAKDDRRSSIVGIWLAD